MAKNDFDKSIDDTKKRFYLYEQMLEEGICPYVGMEPIEKKLKDLPEEERRRIKRKFRKLWRKMAKAEMKGKKGHQLEALKKRYGVGRPASKENKKFRRSVVKSHLERESQKRARDADDASK